MAGKKDGLLIADTVGYFHLYSAHFEGCWHADAPCDKSCALPAQEVTGFETTNAYGPAEVRAGKLGYTILDI